MSQFEQLDSISNKSGGVLRTADALMAGVSKPVLAAFVEARGYERVSHGIYLAPDAWKDSMYILELRCPQVVFSHETALFLHDLTDREPTQYSVTVKTGYNPSRLKADGIKVYTVKKGLYELGITTGSTPFGHSVAVYDLERTVCDVVRSKSSIEAQSFQNALKLYVRRSDKNLSRLMEYAKALRVEKHLRQYLEVLL